MDQVTTLLTPADSHGTARAYGCLSASFRQLERDIRRRGAFYLIGNQMRLPCEPYRYS